jgi:hypothetical protein
MRSLQPDSWPNRMNLRVRAALGPRIRRFATRGPRVMRGVMVKEENSRKLVWLKGLGVAGVELTGLLTLMPALAVPIRNTTAGRMAPVSTAIEMYRDGCTREYY